MREGGPLAIGGADLVIVDDAFMAPLIPLIKHLRSSTRVVYSSHIAMRADLIEEDDSPQNEVWQFISQSIRHADLMIFEPVKGVLPKSVDLHKVGLMPATADWLDGLNKSIDNWDAQYYFRRFARHSIHDGMPILAFPTRGYICQIAQFENHEGVVDVFEAYMKLRRRLAEEGFQAEETPQLLICNHGAVDEREGTGTYHEAVAMRSNPQLADIAGDIIIMRSGPCDQLLNVLISNSRIALRLSHHADFEIEISEALHKGIPVIAYKVGGIPLQIRHAVNGYLIDEWDTDAVAEHLFNLWTNQDGLYEVMRSRTHSWLGDEITTVSSAACWCYLASELSSGRSVRPNGAWIYDLMRAGVKEPIQRGEVLLSREVSIRTAAE